MRILLLGILLWAPVVSAEIYRYVDQNGSVVLSRQGVPQEAIQKGYEVLNHYGRVIRVVPPPPTASELQQRRDAEAQEKIDKRLRLLYSGVADLDAAREHKLRTMDAFVTVIAGNLQLTRDQISGLEQRAALLERAGKPADPAINSQLEYLRGEHRKLEAELQRRQQMRQQVNEEFEHERSRLQQLYPTEPRR